MGLMSPKYVVLGILCGYPATEVDLLIPSGRKAVQVRVLPPAPFIFRRPHARARYDGQGPGVTTMEMSSQVEPPLEPKKICEFEAENPLSAPCWFRIGAVRVLRVGWWR